MYIEKPLKKYIRKVKTKLVSGYSVKKFKNRKRFYLLNKNKFLINKYRSKLMHTLLNKMIYKTFEGHQYFISHEKKYNEFVYSKPYFYRFKEAFLVFAKKFILRYKLKKEIKTKYLYSRQSAFGFYPYKRYKIYEMLSSYYTNLLKSLGNSKIPVGFASNYFSHILLDHYKASLFNDHAAYSNTLSIKYGKLANFKFNPIRYKKFKDTYKYNYLYFNVSILRYVQYKDYLDNLLDIFDAIRYFPNMTRNTKVYNILINTMYDLVGRLFKNCDRLSRYIMWNKVGLSDHFRKKSYKAYEDRRMLYSFSRYKLQNVRQIYMSYLKNLLIRYFKVNLHFKFTKTNIFITVTNYKGHVKYKTSIGLIGYKKDKKKTYYAAKELIKITIPKLFNIFKIKNKALLTSIHYIQTDLFKMYMDMFNLHKTNEELDTKILCYKRKSKMADAIRRIIINTMRKFITLRIILRGSKSKLRGLMRRVFKELRKYRLLNNKYLVRILFLALNTKPHNGCRSAKKGRRRTKRRKQRLRFKILDKNKEFEQKMLRKQLIWRRKIMGIRNKAIPNYIYKNPLDRKTNNLNNLARNKNIRMSNFIPNLKPSTKYHFVYPKVRKRRSTSYRKLPYKYRIWRDHERWSNPLAIKPNKIEIKKKKLTKKPIFYKVGRNVGNSIF